MQILQIVIVVEVQTTELILRYLAQVDVCRRKDLVDVEESCTDLAYTNTLSALGG
jgi:hypothetical protein